MLTNYHMHPCPSFIRPVGKTRTELWSGLWTALDRPFFMGIIFLFLFFFCFVFFWGGGGARRRFWTGQDKFSKQRKHVLCFHSL